MSSILVVCTGNICRSPVGEAVLQSQLSGGVAVSSAGTHAVVGAPAEPEVQEFLRREVGLEANHTARQLTRDQADSAHLIITMTSEHRSWVARNAPRAVRRTFTLKELSLLLESLPSESRFTSLKDLALGASRLRPRLAGELAELDIADPYGGPPEAYESSFREVLDFSRRVADAMRHRLQST